MVGDLASADNCRGLLIKKLEILDIIRVECKDQEAQEFYTDQITILIDSLSDFIAKK